MTEEIKAYLIIEAKVAAAFNFFINGMICGLLYHNADAVATDVVSIAIDLVITCLLTFTLTSFFCKASLRRTKTEGIFICSNNLFRFLSRIYRQPVLFVIFSGFTAALLLTLPVAAIFTLFGTTSMQFGWYVVYKIMFSASLGAGITVLEMYLGMCRPE